MIYFPENKIIKPFSDLLIPKPKFFMPQRARMGATGAGGGGAGVKFDEYAGSNRNTDNNIGYASGGVDEAAGQAITLASNTTITAFWVYIKKNGSPSFNLNVTIYNATGTVGSTGKPTGSILYTSGNIDYSGVGTGSFTMTEAVFSSKPVLTAGDYCFELISDAYDTSNFMRYGVDSTSSSHAGNAFKRTAAGPTWTEQGTNDCCFEIWGY